MPLAERVIEPNNLGAHPLNLRESENGTTHHAVATNCLVGILYQLASLVRQADDLFCDISDECRKVLERTQNINKKIEHINHHVQNLDAKIVKIPIGDLSAYSRADDYHTAKHGFEIDLFTVDSRPQCIIDHYNTVNQTPACKLRGADLYRKDGLCTERLFTLWPIVLNEHKVRTPDLNLPRKLKSVFTFEKKYKRLKSRPKTITSLDELYNEEEKKNKENEKPYDVPRFPPSEKVTISVTGQSFQQMESFRQALLHIEREDTKKKKKRKSISGVPEDIMKEIEKFEKKRRSTSGHDVRDYYFDDLDESVKRVDRDEEMAKYFDEVDAKIEERMEEEVFMKERKIMKFLPCKRSKSLPRCVRLYKPNEKRQSVVGNINTEGSSLSLASSGTCASRISRSTKRSSIISNKFKILVSGNSKQTNSEKLRPRPKSLDLDAIDFNDNFARSNLARTKMPSMPDGVFNNTTAEMRRNVGPGTYYNFESTCNTLPRRQPKRSESPWEYLPKDWTSSVKLREINKGRSKEDRQSSSGHWSGTNSNRHSLDSDNVKSDINPKSTSQISLGQDSGRGSPLPLDERGSTDTNGGYIGDSGSTATDGTSVQEGKLDTENWLRTLAIRAAARDEISTSSAETLNSLTKLTRQNIEALDLMMSPSRRKPRLIEDEECSEYSVDQEGFYTSFHNDSGLRKSSATLVDEDELSHSKDSHSICSFDSVIHNPESDKYAGIKKNQNCKSLNKVTPPLPPKRTSSMSSVNSKSQSKETSPGSISRQDSMFSDTDQETFFQRVEDKSKISSHGIPSLCTMTSDDESVIGKGESSGELYDKNSCKAVREMNQNLADPSTFSQVSDGRSMHGSCSMDGISVFTITSDQSTFEFDESESVQEDRKTLRRKTLSNVDGSFDCTDYTKSWPRSNKKEDTKSVLSSILKNTDNSRPSKSLYFSPVLNMFDSAAQDGFKHSVQEEPKTASKEELEKMGDNSSYMLSIPMADGSTEENKSELPSKYQPVLVVKPGMGRNDSIKNGCENLNIGTQDASAKSCSFAITGNPKSNVMNNFSENDTSLHTTSFSNLTGSINSINSEFSMPDSLTYVSMTSNCSSPNLSNMDIPAVLTPTGSMDSLVNSTKQYSDSVDNSNLSTTMETVAITTNSFSSFNSTKEDDQKSFRTFSGELIPVSPPFSTSTPYTSSAGFPCQPGMNHFQESPVSYSENNTGNQQGRMHSSRSFPSDMKNATQIETKRHSIGTRPHPVVNLNNINNEDYTTNALPSSRTDSYRVAMVNPSRSGSYRVAMNESASYPSFNNSSKRSTTPRVNVTNQMISQSHEQQTTNQNTQNDHQRLSQKSYQSQQSFQSSGSTGKGRYNPLYASMSDSVRAPSVQSSHNQTKNQDLSRRKNSDKTPSPSLDLNRKHSTPQGQYQKHPSPSLGHQQKEPSPSLDLNRKHSTPQGQYQKHPSPSLGRQQKEPSPSQGRRQKEPSPSQGRHQKEPSPSQGHHQIKQLPSQGSHGNRSSSQNHQKYQKNFKVEQQSAGQSYSAIVVTGHNNIDPTNVRSNQNMPGTIANDPNCRTDSYRVALGTNYDNPARNTSYRVAVKDTDPLIADNRLDIIDSITTGGRDSRRMGITNIDQVKTVEQQDTTPESQKQQVVRRRKPDVDPISVLSNRESSSSKTNKNRFSSSSTFIQFDPISEDWEFMMNSSDSLSQFSNNSDKDLLDNSGIVSRDPVRVNAMTGGKMNQEKSSSSLLGSIKSTFKSMSGKQTKDPLDEGRFSLV